jgi:hypothetical protein
MPPVPEEQIYCTLLAAPTASVVWSCRKLVLRKSLEQRLVRSRGLCVTDPLSATPYSVMACAGLLKNGGLAKQRFSMSL